MAKQRAAYITPPPQESSLLIGYLSDNPGFHELLEDGLSANEQVFGNRFWIVYGAKGERICKAVGRLMFGISESNRTDFPGVVGNRTQTVTRTRPGDAMPQTANLFAIIGRIEVHRTDPEPVVTNLIDQTNLTLTDLGANLWLPSIYEPDQALIANNKFLR